MEEAFSGDDGGVWKVRDSSVGDDFGADELCSKIGRSAEEDAGERPDVKEGEGSFVVGGKAEASDGRDWLLLRGRSAECDGEEVDGDPSPEAL